MSPIIVPTAPDSGLTFDTIVDRAQTFGPEVPQATVVSFANARLNRMIAEADYRQKVTTIATTVADQAAYDIPSDVIDIRSLWVSTNPYSRVGWDVIQDLTAGRREVYGDGGVFAPYDDTDGNPQIILYPTPSTTGDEITAQESYQGADIAYGGGNYTILPAHIRPALLAGVQADVFDYQGRQDMAEKYEAVFADGTERLRRYKNSRVGSGPARIGLRGRW